MMWLPLVWLWRQGSAGLQESLCIQAWFCSAPFSLSEWVDVTPAYGFVFMRWLQASAAAWHHEPGKNRERNQLVRGLMRAEER